MNTIPSDWTPTTPNINALPDPIRHYIHQLETRTDPAGDVRRIAELKDQNAALEALYRSVKDEKEQLTAALGEPAAWRIRRGASDLWAYAETEWDADFFGSQGGMRYVKEPLYSLPADAMMKAREGREG